MIAATLSQNLYEVYGVRVKEAAAPAIGNASPAAAPGTPGVGGAVTFGSSNSPGFVSQFQADRAVAQPPSVRKPPTLAPVAKSVLKPVGFKRRDFGQFRPQISTRMKLAQLTELTKLARRGGLRGRLGQLVSGTAQRFDPAQRLSYRPGGTLTGTVPAAPGIPASQTKLTGHTGGMRARVSDAVGAVRDRLGPGRVNTLRVGSSEVPLVRGFKDRATRLLRSREGLGQSLDKYQRKYRTALEQNRPAEARIHLERANRRQRVLGSLDMQAARRDQGRLWRDAYRTQGQLSRTEGTLGRLRGTQERGTRWDLIPGNRMRRARRIDELTSQRDTLREGLKAQTQAYNKAQQLGQSGNVASGYKSTILDAAKARSAFAPGTRRGGIITTPADAEARRAAYARSLKRGMGTESSPGALRRRITEGTGAKRVDARDYVKDKRVRPGSAVREYDAAAAGSAGEAGAVGAALARRPLWQRALYMGPGMAAAGAGLGGLEALSTEGSGVGDVAMGALRGGALGASPLLAGGGMLAYNQMRGGAPEKSTAERVVQARQEGQRQREPQVILPTEAQWEQAQAGASGGNRVPPAATSGAAQERQVNRQQAAAAQANRRVLQQQRSRNEERAQQSLPQVPPSESDSSQTFQ